MTLAAPSQEIACATESLPMPRSGEADTVSGHWPTARDV